MSKCHIFCYKHELNKREPMKLNEYLIIYLHTGLPFLLKVVFLDTKILWKLGHVLTKYKRGYKDGMWYHLDYTLSLMKGRNWTLSVFIPECKLARWRAQNAPSSNKSHQILRKYISNFVNIKYVCQRCGKDAGGDPKTTSMRTCRTYLQQVYL